MNISLEIKALMRKKKLTQSELADKIGMSLIGFNQALKTNDFKISVLQKIADALEVDITYFFTGSNVIGNQNIIQDATASINDYYNKFDFDIDSVLKQLLKDFKEKHLCLLVNNYFLIELFHAGYCKIKPCEVWDINNTARIVVPEKIKNFYLQEIPEILTQNNFNELLQFKIRYFRNLKSIYDFIIATNKTHLAYIMNTLQLTPELDRKVKIKNDRIFVEEDLLNKIEKKIQEKYPAYNKEKFPICL